MDLDAPITGDVRTCRREETPGGSLLPTRASEERLGRGVTSDGAKQIFGQRRERSCKRITVCQGSGGTDRHETPGRTRRTEELR